MPSSIKIGIAALREVKTILWANSAHVILFGKHNTIEVRAGVFGYATVDGEVAEMTPQAWKYFMNEVLHLQVA